MIIVIKFIAVYQLCFERIFSRHLALLTLFQKFGLKKKDKREVLFKIFIQVADFVKLSRFYHLDDGPRWYKVDEIRNLALKIKKQKVSLDKKVH